MSLMDRLAGKGVYSYGVPVVCQECRTHLVYSDLGFSHLLGFQEGTGIECPECGAEQEESDYREDYRQEEPLEEVA